MNSPELIATLALGNVISKELAQRMLGVADEAVHIASIDRTIVQHLDVGTVKSGAAIAAKVASK